jgi:pimeloyl-ACP methyl ester carboxylesterase
VAHREVAVARLSVPPVERRIALKTGLAYHMLEWGADSDHTVLLLHGFLDFAWSFAPLVGAGLAGTYHIVAPDLRGHGDSDRVGAGGYYHFADYLPDVHDLIRQTARRRLSIVGHSMGGTVASYYTATFPARVEKLALLEGLGPPETPMPMGPERMLSWIGAWDRVVDRPQRSFASVDEAAERLLEHDKLLSRELAVELARRGTTQGEDGRLRFKHDPLHATIGPYGGFQLEIAQRFWRRIGCPVLLVEGGLSDLRHTPEETARRTRLFTDLQRATVEGAGHMMQRHQPERLALLLTAFLG